jgi:hypothetical protein
VSRRLLLGILAGASEVADGVQISDQDINDFQIGQVASVEYSLLANGTAFRATSITGPQQIPFEWTNPTLPLGPSYEVRATLLGGTAPSGTVGSWLSLASNRNWSLSLPTPGFEFCVLLVEIRRAVDSTVVATATISLTASYEV